MTEDILYEIVKLLFACSFLLCLLLAMQKQRQHFFEEISSAHSGITFNNKIIENDSINPLDVVNIYNGGGVGIGDFNNDGIAGYLFYRQYGTMQIVSEQRKF